MRATRTSNMHRSPEEMERAIMEWREVIEPITSYAAKLAALHGRPSIVFIVHSDGTTSDLRMITDYPDPIRRLFDYLNEIKAAEARRLGLILTTDSQTSAPP